MLVSWRNAGEEKGTLNHRHIFTMGEKRDGKGPREFMIYLIQESTAVDVALNGKNIWTSTDYSNNPEELVLKAMIGEPREASILITVDYSKQGDWIDNECHGCGGLWGTHVDCPTLAIIHNTWLQLARRVVEI